MRITFSSGSLRLVGEYTAGVSGCSVICHPHPLYGGNMENNVVLAVDEGLRRAGRATLRFNFRGVGGSDGSYEAGAGESDDVLAAAAEAMQRSGAGTCLLAGYSFGAMMVVQTAVRAIAEAVIVVAPPLAFAGLDALGGFTRPKLFVAGDRDSYCAVADLQRAAAALSEPKEVRILSGADHFFGGFEADIAAAVAGRG